MIHSDPIIRRIHACMLAGVPPFLWGGPGTGKTARVFAYGRMTSRPVERWLLSRCEPIDIRPRVYHEGRMIVSDAPEITRAAEARGILFFDELNLSSRETEGSALNLLDNPPDGVFPIAAGNPPARGQAARSLGAPAANRFCHLDVEADPKSWASAMGGAGWDLPAVMTTAQETLTPAALAEAKTLAAAFIRSQPQKLEALPDSPAAAGKAWASPRTWEYAARLLATSRVLSLPEDDVLALVCGCIGDGIGTEFAAFADLRDLPDPEAVLKDPSAYVPPQRVDRIIAACAGIVSAVSRDLTPDRWKAAWKLTQVILDASQPDSAMVLSDMLVADVYKAKPVEELDAKKIVKPGLLMPARIATMFVGAAGK